MVNFTELLTQLKKNHTCMVGLQDHHLSHAAASVRAILQKRIDETAELLTNAGWRE